MSNYRVMPGSSLGTFEVRRTATGAVVGMVFPLSLTVAEQTDDWVVNLGSKGQQYARDRDAAIQIVTDHADAHPDFTLT